MRTIPELIEWLLNKMGRKANAKPRPYRALRNPCADGKTHRWDKLTGADGVHLGRICAKCSRAEGAYRTSERPQPEAAP